MAWDLSRVETLPFPGSRPEPTDVPHPLDGISRSLAITGMGG
jgi:error-prone DNA polymerase